jgi:late competence protein required for DNA uptake (superfamily II DNA/RNA helicase)
MTTSSKELSKELPRVQEVTVSEDVRQRLKTVALTLDALTVAESGTQHCFGCNSNTPHWGDRTNGGCMYCGYIAPGV